MKEHKERAKKMSRKIIVCLVGKSAAGKDSLALLLSRQPGWHNVVSCTTRPKREKEKSMICLKLLILIHGIMAH